MCKQTSGETGFCLLIWLKGECVVEDGRFVCRCQLGWAGDDCSVPSHSTCQLDTCLNNATCVDDESAFTCICSHQFTGTRNRQHHSAGVLKQCPLCYAVPYLRVKQTKTFAKIVCKANVFCFSLHVTIRCKTFDKHVLRHLAQLRMARRQEHRNICNVLESSTSRRWAQVFTLYHLLLSSNRGQSC